MPARKKKEKATDHASPLGVAASLAPWSSSTFPPCAAAALGRNRESDDDERDLGDLSLRPATCLLTPPVCARQLSTSSSHLSATVTVLAYWLATPLTSPCELVHSPLAISSSIAANRRQLLLLLPVCTASIRAVRHQTHSTSFPSPPFFYFPPPFDVSHRGRSRPR